MSVRLSDVAASAGVSVGTVSNVLNRPEKVSDEIRERVNEVIERLGYVRNDAARQLRAGRSTSIGIVVLDVGNPFFADVIRGVEDRAGDIGMVVLVGNSDESPSRERAYLDLFHQQRVNGVLITPTGTDTTALERLRDAGTAVVLVDRELPGAGFRSVTVDDVEGGRLAVDHLLSLGRRRIAFVAGPTTLSQVSDRLAGARLAVAEVPDARLDVVERAALTVPEGRAAAAELLERSRQHRPDAVFCANDLLAVGFLQEVMVRSAARIPEDIALIGYDDIDYASTTVVPLSSIRQPAALIGATAVDLMQREVDGDADERVVRFRPELVVRQSTVASATGRVASSSSSRM